MHRRNGERKAKKRKRKLIIKRNLLKCIEGNDRKESKGKVYKNANEEETINVRR